MTIFSSIWGISAILSIILLHVLGAICSGIFGKICKYVNIALHIPLAALFVCLRAPMSEGVAVYLGSLFLYMLLSYARFFFDRRNNNDV